MQAQAEVYDLFDATINAMSDATIVTVQYALAKELCEMRINLLMFSEGVDERLFQILDAITKPPLPNFNQQLQKRLLLTLQKSATSLSALLYWNRQVRFLTVATLPLNSLVSSASAFRYCEIFWVRPLEVRTKIWRLLNQVRFSSTFVL